MYPEAKREGDLAHRIADPSGIPITVLANLSNRRYMVADSFRGWILSSRDSERSDGDEEYFDSVLQKQVVLATITFQEKKLENDSATLESNVHHWRAISWQCQYRMEPSANPGWPSDHPRIQH
jgi:hypothetical protein